jgi:hypothetical protein
MKRALCSGCTVLCKRRRRDARGFFFLFFSTPRLGSATSSPAREHSPSPFGLMVISTLPMRRAPRACLGGFGASHLAGPVNCVKLESALRFVLLSKGTNAGFSRRSSFPSRNCECHALVVRFSLLLAERERQEDEEASGPKVVRPDNFLDVGAGKREETLNFDFDRTSGVRSLGWDTEIRSLDASLSFFVSLSCLVCGHGPESYLRLSVLSPHLRLCVWAAYLCPLLPTLVSFSPARLSFRKSERQRCEPAAGSAESAAANHTQPQALPLSPGACIQSD